LVFVTKWANAAAAEEFRKLYGGTVAKRYQMPPQKPGQGPDVPAARIGGTGGDTRISGTIWNTTDGYVDVTSFGDLVIAVESVPAEIADKVRDAVVTSAIRADSSGAKAPSE
jgi:hypothetical protein